MKNAINVILLTVCVISVIAAGTMVGNVMTEYAKCKAEKTVANRKNK